MRDGKPVLLPKWWSPPGPAATSAPGPASESEAGSNACICRYANFLASAADALQDSRCRAARVCHGRGAGLSPGAWNTIREAISRDTPSDPRRLHAFRKNRTRSATGTFSGHRQRSRRICHQEVGLPSLSDDERLLDATRSVCRVLKLAEITARPRRTGSRTHEMNRYGTPARLTIRYAWTA